MFLRAQSGDEAADGMGAVFIAAVANHVKYARGAKPRMFFKGLPEFVNTFSTLSFLHPFPLLFTALQWYRAVFVIQGGSVSGRFWISLNGHFGLSLGGRSQSFSITLSDVKSVFVFADATAYNAVRRAENPCQTVF